MNIEHLPTIDNPVERYAMRVVWVGIILAAAVAWGTS